jgi:hypothetical protein
LLQKEEACLSCLLLHPDFQSLLCIPPGIKELTGCIEPNDWIGTVTFNTSQFAVDNVLHRLYFRWRKPNLLIRKDFLKSAQPFIAFATWATRPLAHFMAPQI